MKYQQLLMLSCFVLAAFSFRENTTADKLSGAWETGPETMRMTKIFSDKYFSVAIYNLKDKQFIATAGGSWRLDGNALVETFEYHTQQPEKVGTEIRTPLEFKGQKLILKPDSKPETWTRLDDGTPGKLAGAWLITGRVTNDGNISRRTPGARRTMKILSGTRFQWIAYNVDTKEFFGTGGGTYTTKDGKYTENIDFFSRDSSRVGASLEFDYSIEEGDWRHKGLSSKGDPLDEVWSKREKIGI
jgi:hypothetical protein